VKGQGRYQFPGGFSFVGLVYISKLIDLHLPADGYRLALKLMATSGYGGVCSLPNKQIAAELGIDKSRVSRLVALLERAGVCQRFGTRRGAIMVNPTFCFRGSKAEQDKAIQEWCRVRPIGIVPQRKTA
jgi:hypothetical protein